MLKYQGMIIRFLGVVMLLVFWLPACGGGSEEPVQESSEAEEVAEEVETVFSVEEEEELGDEEYNLVIKSEAGALKDLFDQDARYGHVSLSWVGGWLVKDGVVQTEATVTNILDGNVSFISSCEAKQKWKEQDIDVFSATLGVDEAGSVVMNIPTDKLNPNNKVEMTELLGRGSYGPEQVNENFSADFGPGEVSTKTFNGCFKHLYADQQDTFYEVNFPGTSMIPGVRPVGVVIDSEVELARELFDGQLSTAGNRIQYRGTDLPWTYDKKVSPYKDVSGKVHPALIIDVGHKEDEDHVVTVGLYGGRRIQFYFE